jgi:hypothetical protein
MRLISAVNKNYGEIFNIENLADMLEVSKSDLGRWLKMVDHNEFSYLRELEYLNIEDMIELFTTFLVSFSDLWETEEDVNNDEIFDHPSIFKYVEKYLDSGHDENCLLSYLKSVALAIES